MDTRYLVFAVLALGGLSASGDPLVNKYDALRAAAVSTCQSVDAQEYQSGLYFNPDGYRSYYARSMCYQKAAITFRDLELCALVKRRLALFSSSWGYSKSNCRKLVSGGIAQDREVLDRMKKDYEQSHVHLADFRIERNGNGRDIDIIPNFSGEGAHPYELRFEILREDSNSPPVLIDASGFSLKGAGDNIRIFVRTSDIRRRFPGFALNQTWPVRATLIYSAGTGTYQGQWSPDFIESRFPVKERTQILTRGIRF